MKRVFAIIAVFLVICCSMLPCFADGSGYSETGQPSQQRGGHTGYSVVISNGSFMNDWSFDNVFLPYDGLNSRYELLSTNVYSYNLTLDSFVYPPTTLDETVLRVDHNCIQPVNSGNDTTVYFNDFVPNLSQIDDYYMEFYQNLDCEVSFTYYYLDGISVASDSVYISHENVNRVEFLDGIGGDVLAISDLTVTIYNAANYSWLSLYTPITDADLLQVSSALNGLYSDYEVKEVDFIDGIFSWLDDFLEIKLFGDFGLGHLVGIMITICCAIWVLKIVAGG